MRVTVVGAGVAGLAAALAFARRGHAVTVLERDPHDAPRSADRSFDDWDRPGVPHFRLPHLFLGLGRKLLATHLPDVLAALHRAGALDVPFRDRVPGGPGPQDDELLALACRRPLLEWALRTAVEGEPHVTFRSDTRVEELVGSGTGTPRIVGVRTQRGEVIDSDLVVDASGRNTRIALWLQAIGAKAPHEEADPCGVIYHSRYYRLRDGIEFPTQGSLFGPRGDLGYMSFATFPGEDRTWALALSVPAWDDDLRAIRREEAFTAVARTIPSLVPLLDGSDALTGVGLMGELRNRIRTLVVDGEPVALGIVPIGDALAQTDPSFGWGISLALDNAFRLAGIAHAHASEPRLVALAFDAEIRTWSETYFRDSRAADQARTARWKAGTGPAPASAIMLASRVDPDIHRAFVRRLLLLDPVEPLETNAALVARAAAIVAERGLEGPPPPAGPARDAVLALLREPTPA